MDEQMREPAIVRFNASIGDELDPVERLRFFCSIAMSGQDWIDVEPLFDDLAAALSQPAAQVDSSHSAGGECGGVPDWIETMATLAQLVYTANGNRYADINELLKKAGDLITKAKATP